MRIALVHDYLAQDGGAERVLKAFHEMWPEAPIFVLFHDKKKITGFNEERIRESFLAKFPFIRSKFQWYLPLMATATEHHDLDGFDVILSSSSSFAKGVLTSPNTLHISYCHTPTRFLWSDSHHYITDLHRAPAVKAFLPGLLTRLRLWDKMSADRVDCFIANSRTVQSRIQKYYRRTSDVIHPPVDWENFFITDKLSDYFVAGGRLVPYKNLQLVIKTFNRLGLPLKIFGTGPEMSYLQHIARPNIEFLGRISDVEKAYLLSCALAYIHPQVEDFGITPLEAMASGRPVIAYPVGGATETIIANTTGTFFPAQTWESLYEAVQNFDPIAWDSAKIREHASLFRTEQFKQNIHTLVTHRFEEFTRGLEQPTLPV